MLKLWFDSSRLYESIRITQDQSAGNTRSVSWLSTVRLHKISQPAQHTQIFHVFHALWFRLQLKFPTSFCFHLLSYTVSPFVSKKSKTKPLLSRNLTQSLYSVVIVFILLSNWTQRMCVGKSIKHHSGYTRSVSRLSTPKYFTFYALGLHCSWFFCPGRDRDPHWCLVCSNWLTQPQRPSHLGVERGIICL